MSKSYEVIFENNQQWLETKNNSIPSILLSSRMVRTPIFCTLDAPTAAWLQRG